MTDIQNRLASLADPEFRSFHMKLIPTVKPERVLGVRTPAVRALAKEIMSEPDDCRAFLDDLPHRFYDEDQLHAVIISGMRDVCQAMTELEKFLPYVDNWATCDILSPSCFKKDPKALRDFCHDTLVPFRSSDVAPDMVYTVRFAVNMLMKFFLGDRLERWMPDTVASLVCTGNDERFPRAAYYLDMGAAWYFATALAYNRGDILPYLSERGRLRDTVRRMAVRKSVESYRIDDKTKAHLRESLK